MNNLKLLFCFLLILVVSFKDVYSDWCGGVECWEDVQIAEQHCYNYYYTITSGHVTCYCCSYVMD